MFGAITGVWWLFLITGIAWLIIGLIVLRFDTTSIATVGALLGVVFLIAGLNEGMIAVVRPSWKWATSRSGSCMWSGGSLRSPVHTTRSGRSRRSSASCSS